MKLSHQAIGDYTSEELNLLPSDVRVLLNQMGAEVEGIDEVEGDSVYDIDTTPNRPDWLGVVGMVREMTAATRDDVTAVLKAIDGDYSSLPTESISVSLQEEDQCPRYLARQFEDITVGDSPEWLKTYLRKIGMRSVNNVVDILSFVMHETGHPLHAFDASKLTGRLSLRNAGAGESIECLDGTTREMPEGSIVISDDSGDIQAAAGIIGSKKSQVTSETQSIVVESAYFEPVSVRKAAKAMRISTDASFRFERGADHAMPAYSLDRASDLIASYCNGTATRNYAHDVKVVEPRTIQLTVEKVGKLLGAVIEKDFIVQALQKLGFIIEDNGDTLQVRVPSWRLHDVKFEACLVEEVGKVFGFDNIPNVMPKIEMNATHRSSELDVRDAVERSLVERGFNQTLNFGFISTDAVGQFNPAKDSKLSQYPRVHNPLTADASIMRPSLVPGLLENYNYNFDRGERDIKLFEMGHIFQQSSNTEMPQEKRMVAGLLSGSVEPASWADKSRVANFYDMKSTVYRLLSDAGVDVEKIAIAPSSLEIIENDMGATRSIDGTEIGSFGALNENVVKPGKQRSPVYVFELDMNAITHLADNAPRKIEEASKFPSIQRDIALVCDQSLQSQLIVQEIAGVGGDIVKRIKLFDVYEGKGMPNGKISLAFSIEFNSLVRSLTSEEVAGIMGTIIKNLNTKYGLELRQ